MPPLRREIRMALIEAKNIKMYFPVQRGFIESMFKGDTTFVRAIDDVSLHIEKGETLGLARVVRERLQWEDYACVYSNPLKVRLSMMERISQISKGRNSGFSGVDFSSRFKILRLR